LEGRTPKKNVLSFLEEIGRAQIRKARNIFLWCPPRLCEAVAGLIHSSSFRSKKVRAKCIITAPPLRRESNGPEASREPPSSGETTSAGGSELVRVRRGPGNEGRHSAGRGETSACTTFKEGIKSTYFGFTA